MCLGVSQHQTADAGMGLHRTTLSQSDTDLFHIKQIVENEVQTSIGQRRITHSGTNALEFLDKHLWNGQLLIFGIAPELLSNLFMYAFSSSLSQTIGQQLRQHLLIGIRRKVGLKPHIH